MTKMDKLEILDACTNGDIEKFHKLVHTKYEHLNIFFHLCKDSVPAEKINDIQFESDTDNDSTFSIICISDKSEIQLLTSIETCPKGVTVQEVDEGFVVNISTVN